MPPRRSGNTLKSAQTVPGNQCSRPLKGSLQTGWCYWFLLEWAGLCQDDQEGPNARAPALHLGLDSVPGLSPWPWSCCRPWSVPASAPYCSRGRPWPCKTQARAGARAVAISIALWPQGMPLPRWPCSTSWASPARRGCFPANCARFGAVTPAGRATS